MERSYDNDEKMREYVQEMVSTYRPV